MSAERSGPRTRQIRAARDPQVSRPNSARPVEVPVHGSSAIRRLYAVLAVFGALLTLGVPTSGCSLIGLAGGAVIDASRPATVLTPTGKLYAFRRGDPLVLRLRDSSVVTGRYAGYERIDATAYRSRFAAFRAAHPGPALPAPGARVDVDRSGTILGGRRSGELVGFLLDAVEIRRENGRTMTLPYRNVERVCWEGGDACLSRRDIIQLRLRGELPLAQSITLDSAGVRAEVPLDDVAFVEGPPLRDAARKGFMLGLTADALIVVAVIAVASSYQGPFDGADCDASPGLYSARMETRIERTLALTARAREDRS